MDTIWGSLPTLLCDYADVGAEFDVTLVKQG